MSDPVTRGAQLAGATSPLVLPASGNRIRAPSDQAVSSAGRAVIDSAARGTVVSRELVQGGARVETDSAAKAPDSAAGSGLGFGGWMGGGSPVVACPNPFVIEASGGRLSPLRRPFDSRASRHVAEYGALLRDLGHNLKLSLRGIDEQRAGLHLEESGVHTSSFEAFEQSFKKLHRLSDEIVTVGALKLKHDPFQLDFLKRELLAQLMPQLSEANLTLVFDSWDIKDVFYGDPLWIGQILTNFISNAIKYSPKGGMVLVSLKTESAGSSYQRLHFEVNNKGSTLSVDKQRLLFKPFSQVGASAEGSVAGVGLGLAFCKILVDQMNPVDCEDYIGVRSSPVDGTTFWFDIQSPCYQEEGASPLSRCGSYEGSPGSFYKKREMSPSFTPLETEPVHAVGALSLQHSQELFSFYIHELRTPLQSVLLCLDEFKGRVEVPAQQAIIKEIKNRTKALSDLIDTFLGYKKCLEGAITIISKDFGWSELTGFIDSMQESFKDREQTLELVFVGPVKLRNCSFKGDKKNLFDAIGHLLNYASSHSPLGAPIRLKITLEPLLLNKVKFVFQVEAPLVFEESSARFFLPPTEGQLMSKGFRPYIAAHLLSLMNPQPGVSGASFIEGSAPCYGLNSCEDSYVCIWANVALDVMDVAAPVKVASSSSSSLAGLRILFLEDDLVSRSLVSRSLQRAGCEEFMAVESIEGAINAFSRGYKSSSSESRDLSLGKFTSEPGGESDALEGGVSASAEKRLPYDLILSDRNLGDGHVSDLIEHVRSIAGREGAIPIIILTGTSDDDFDRYCEAKGVGAVLTKPVNIANLIQRAAELARAYKDVKKA